MLIKPTTINRENFNSEKLIKKLESMMTKFISEFINETSLNIKMGISHNFNCFGSESHSMYLIQNRDIMFDLNSRVYHLMDSITHNIIKFEETTNKNPSQFVTFSLIENMSVDIFAIYNEIVQIIRENSNNKMIYDPLIKFMTDLKSTILESVKDMKDPNEADIRIRDMIISMHDIISHCILLTKNVISKHSQLNIIVDNIKLTNNNLMLFDDIMGMFDGINAISNNDNWRNTIMFDKKSTVKTFKSDGDNGTSSIILNANLTSTETLERLFTIIGNITSNMDDGNNEPCCDDYHVYVTKGEIKETTIEEEEYNNIMDFKKKINKIIKTNVSNDISYESYVTVNCTQLGKLINNIITNTIPFVDLFHLDKQHNMKLIFTLLDDIFGSIKDDIRNNVPSIPKRRMYVNFVREMVMNLTSYANIPKKIKTLIPNDVAKYDTGTYVNNLTDIIDFIIITLKTNLLALESLSVIDNDTHKSSDKPTSSCISINLMDLCLDKADIPVFDVLKEIMTDYYKLDTTINCPPTPSEMKNNPKLTSYDSSMIIHIDANDDRCSDMLKKIMALINPLFK